MLDIASQMNYNFGRNEKETKRKIRKMVISRLDIGYPIYPKGSDFHCFYSSLPELLNKEKRAGGNPIDCSHALPNSGLLHTKNPVSG